MRARTATRSMISGGSFERSARGEHDHAARYVEAPRAVRVARERRAVPSSVTRLAARNELRTAPSNCRAAGVPAQIELRLVDRDAAVGIAAHRRSRRRRRRCGLPSAQACRRAPISARSTAESGTSAANWLPSTRSASIRSFGETSRTTISMVRRPSARGVTVAVSDHRPSAPVELTAKATPPLARPRQAEIDVFEGPALAVALIVHHEGAVLEADSRQRAAVEPERARACRPRRAARRADWCEHIDRRDRGRHRAYAAPGLTRTASPSGGRSSVAGSDACRRRRRSRRGRPARCAATSRRRSG